MHVICDDVLRSNQSDILLCHPLTAGLCFCRATPMSRTLTPPPLKSNQRCSLPCSVPPPPPFHPFVPPPFLSLCSALSTPIHPSIPLYLPPFDTHRSIHPSFLPSLSPQHHTSTPTSDQTAPKHPIRPPQPQNQQTTSSPTPTQSSQHSFIISASRPSCQLNPRSLSLSLFGMSVTTTKMDTLSTTGGAAA